MSLRRITCDPLIPPRQWARWLNDRSTSRYLESRGRWTERRVRQWVIDHLRTPDTRLYAICLEGQFVGTLKLEGVQPGGWANVALMIGDSSARGCGIGRRAIGLGCQMAERARCAGVWAGMREKNLASRHAFLAAGFSADGVVPPSVVEAIRAWPRRPARMALWRRLRSTRQPAVGGVERRGAVSPARLPTLEEIMACPVPYDEWGWLPQGHTCQTHSAKRAYAFVTLAREIDSR